MSATTTPSTEPRYRVLLLPGSVLPAELAYGALIGVLGDGVDAVAKDLEVYAADAPSADYSLDSEVAGVIREADRVGWNRFHLVGYSGGGASALAVAARAPKRLLSLALLEPAWAGNWNLGAKEQELWKQYEQLESLPPEQFMAGFTRLGLRAGVAPPPPPEGPTPPWMAKRPAGIRAFMNTFKTYALDREALRRFQQLLRPRRAQQPGPVRRDRQAARRRLPRLHARDLRAAPPFRPAAPDRARPARPIAAPHVGARRSARPHADARTRVTNAAVGAGLDFSPVLRQRPRPGGLA